ncbi:MAG: endonuclease/exonuclease/phosphatase family protein, partial [Bdellovibrionaceae bacterium]|nr:endonuclease/exonuclease/phosphatase family protein [Pseudobdellovibrionaceae bacterium]
IVDTCNTFPAQYELRLCELNTENLFISLEHFDGEDLENLSESDWRKLALPQLRYKQKPLNKLWGLATAIFDINPDVLLLVEVGGRESLEHFNHYFLKDAYVPHFVETNSNRSIDLAFLVKKELKLNAKVISNRDLPVRPGAYRGSSFATRFSRDVAELQLFNGDHLELIVLLTHLKSKISTDTDFQGRDLRRAEAEALVELYKQISKKNPKVPIVVGGDLNSDLLSPELEALAQTDLSDFQELIATPTEERISFVHFDYQGQAHPQVLDYLLVSPQLKSCVIKEKSFTYRYKSFYDLPHPLPTTIHQRYHMPSDHFPLVLTLEIPSQA